MLLRDFFAGAPPPAPVGDPTPLTAGATVDVAWSDGGAYPATILGEARGGFYVAFPDGRQLWVPAQAVRLRPTVNGG